MAPNPATIKVGQVQQLTATGTYADSSTADLTSQVTWSERRAERGQRRHKRQGDGQGSRDSAHHGDAGDGERAGDGDGVAAGADGGAARPGTGKQAGRSERADRAGERTTARTGTAITIAQDSETTNSTWPGQQCPGRVLSHRGDDSLSIANLMKSSWRAKQRRVCNDT